MRPIVLTTDHSIVRGPDELVGPGGLRLFSIGACIPPELPEGETWAFVDWAPPGMSGLAVCENLRRMERPPERIVIVLEDDIPAHRRRALAAGADDYMTGPQTLDAIAARIDRAHPGVATVTPTPSDRQTVLKRGEFEIDHGAHRARYRGEAIKLRPRQFRMLHHLVESADSVMTRRQLVEAVAQGNRSVADRTVDKWVARLRQALARVGAGHLLRTVHGAGYVLDVRPAGMPRAQSEEKAPHSPPAPEGNRQG